MNYFGILYKNLCLVLSIVFRCLQCFAMDESYGRPQFLKNLTVGGVGSTSAINCSRHLGAVTCQYRIDLEDKLSFPGTRFDSSSEKKP